MFFATMHLLLLSLNKGRGHFLELGCRYQEFIYERNLMVYTRGVKQKLKIEFLDFQCF